MACFTRCRQEENKHEIYVEADSLLALTLVLQSRISSPEIQRMHDFQEEINEDLSVLSPALEADPSIAKYLELHVGLGECLQACNQFHEEAYLLESSLLEIMDRVQSKEADLLKLYELLNFEIDNLEDLSGRIDSSMDLAIRKAEIFYTLKPEIDLIKERFGRIPEPKP